MAVDQSVSENTQRLAIKGYFTRDAQSTCSSLGLFVVGATLFCLHLRLAWTQTNRFLCPLIDIPRYTLMTIELDPEEIGVVFGGIVR